MPNTVYKQWHISGVDNLKVCTSATAHTQNVQGNASGIPLNVLGFQPS
jgi:hypothetical protein